jgi:hypothetical protein
MQDEFKVKGGTVLNRIAQHPFASLLAAAVVAVPCAALTNAVEGGIAGVAMGLLGVAVGAPIGAMIAEEAAA